MEQQKQCHHAERFTPGHDCQYIDARNSLLGFAEGVANRTAGWSGPKVGAKFHQADEARHAWCAAWNVAFFAEMNRLWAARCAGVAKMARAA
jgi:hypothetical protein